jgi:predicted transcriptional regulator of viral defense system
MKFDRLIHLLGNQSCFDLASVVQFGEDHRESLKRQLCRWCKAGKLVPLRRGNYALAPDYRKSAVNPAELANQLYSPSYLSDTWALGFFGLIPERVVVYTSITSRGPKTFQNACGHFRYRHVKPEAFFGYRPMEISGRRVLLAEPEKALLDHWYLGKGEWNESRLSEMRLQNLEQIRCDRLIGYASRFKSLQLSRTVELYVRSIHRLEPEGIEL